MSFQNLIIVHGGELAHDVANQLEKGAASCNPTVRCASERPKTLLKEMNASTLVVFIVQTIENAQPTEEVCGGCCFSRLFFTSS